jgi:uncharacterized membrane protein
MFLKIILVFLTGLIIGSVLEFSYRSLRAKKIIMPKFVNTQMYGSAGVFLVFIYLLDIPLFFELVLILIFPTLIEFITGYLYLRIKGVYLWDYSKELCNFKKLVCPVFSFYWFVIAVILYYLLIPTVIIY